jgi:hypothetical protein
MIHYLHGDEHRDSGWDRGMAKNKNKKAFP